MENDAKNENVGTGLSEEQEVEDRKFLEIVMKALGDPEEPKPIKEYVDESKTERNMRLSDVPYDPEIRHPSAPYISMRTYNCLRRAGCESLSDILDIIEWDLLPGVHNFNQRCVENAIDICIYFCPNETKKRMEVAKTGNERLMKVHEKCKALLLSEIPEELLDKPISEIIPKECLESLPLRDLELTVFRDLCNVVANDGDYDTELFGKRNLFENSVSISLIQTLRICENILTK